MHKSLELDSASRIPDPGKATVFLLFDSTLSETALGCLLKYYNGLSGNRPPPP